MAKYECINEYEMTYNDIKKLKIYLYTIVKGVVVDVAQFTADEYIISFDDRAFMIKSDQLNTFFKLKEPEDTSDKSSPVFKRKYENLTDRELSLELQIIQSEIQIRKSHDLISKLESYKSILDKYAEGK